MTFWDYEQSEDPGAVGALKVWRNPYTESIWCRNRYNTEWIYWGNSALDKLGAMPLSPGCAVSGNLTGVTGWASADNHDFPTTVTRNNIELLDINKMDEDVAAYADTIERKVKASIYKNSTSVDVSNKIAIGHGTLDCGYGSGTITAQTIPLPKYDNGTGDTALEADCKWVVWFSRYYYQEDGNGTPKNVWEFYDGDTDTLVNPTTKRKLKAKKRTIDGNGNITTTGLKFSYLIVAVRS